MSKNNLLAIEKANFLVDINSSYASKHSKLTITLFYGIIEQSIVNANKPQLIVSLADISNENELNADLYPKLEATLNLNKKKLVGLVEILNDLDANRDLIGIPILYATVVIGENKVYSHTRLIKQAWTEEMISEVGIFTGILQKKFKHKPIAI